MARGQKKQPSLPAEGMERQAIPELEEKAEDYRAVRDEWSALGKKMREMKKDMLNDLESRGLARHVYEDHEGVERVIEATVKKNAKVSKVKKPKSADAEIEEDEA